ncbi:MAG: hypothetical protein UX13_C0003G0020 [Candidatus Woesebacteria bacterium GW2011_GWB1_45_5]|uniref:Uncharacterized protein n=1 Tax=Candidatus Woesebacteria bacterium GW2011_GWB1_45_5 TaxID=1618581 RepID=A0A0G1PZB6_9BACT|nr:MAG: hypothetical protein UX13_C0003G0020 [Candidatus Woesebacteria bacterium GW2011_GWB1_45_5]
MKSFDSEIDRLRGVIRFQDKALAILLPRIPSIVSAELLAELYDLRREIKELKRVAKSSE